MLPLASPHDLLFAYDFPPMGGGIARWMEGMAGAFPPGTLLVSTGGGASAVPEDALFANPVDRVVTPAGRLRTVPGLVTWARRADRLARDPGARFAWCSSLRPAGWPAWWARRRRALPYGIILHGGDLLVLEAKLRRESWKGRGLRSVVRHAAVLVANSRWTADRAAIAFESLGLAGALPPIRVVMPGTDPAPWLAVPESVEAFRARRGLPAGRWLVSVSRLVPHKGIDTAIAAVAALRDEFPDLHYAVVGRGRHLDALRTAARDAGVADRVHFLTDVSDAELPAAYRLGEICVGLSRHHATDIEGFGITFLEAAAAERPVVAGASGGTADAVEDGVTGHLVDPATAAPAVEALRRLLRDPALARRMGAAGHERVMRHFTWSRVADDFRAIAAELGRRA